MTTVQGLLAATCRELVELLDAGACAISRVLGDLLVGLEKPVRTAKRLQGLVEVYRSGSRFAGQDAVLAEQLADVAGRRLDQLI